MLSPLSLNGRRRRRGLFGHLVEELGCRIVSGALRPDDAFPTEVELGREFDTSRSVVREAVKALAAKGLLESRTRRGIRVLPAIHWNLLDADVLAWRYSTLPPREFFRELFEIRRMIEPEAAALAARRASDAEIRAMEAAFLAMEEAKATTSAGIAADLAFHRSILAAGHNALLLQVGNLIGVGLLVTYRMSTESFTVFLRRHRAVLSAIRRRRPGQAHGAMDRLLVETRDFLEKHLLDDDNPHRRAPQWTSQGTKR